jgi:hypothetical protein
VLYSPENLAALNAALLDGNFSTLPLSANDRQQLVSDAFALADAGLLDVRQALESSRFLTAERSFGVWSTSLRALRRVAVLLSDSDSYGDMARYLRSRMQPAVSPAAFKLSFCCLRACSGSSDSPSRPLVIAAGPTHLERHGLSHRSNAAQPVVSTNCLVLAWTGSCGFSVCQTCYSVSSLCAG